MRYREEERSLREFILPLGHAPCEPVNVRLRVACQGLAHSAMGEGAEQLNVADVSVPRIPKTLEPEAWKWMIGTNLPPQGPSTPTWPETHVRLRLPCPALPPCPRIGSRVGKHTGRTVTSPGLFLHLGEGRHIERLRPQLPRPPVGDGRFPSEGLQQPNTSPLTPTAWGQILKVDVFRVRTVRNGSRRLISYTNKSLEQ